MASTYVNDLRLNEMGTGDASGSWGTATNTNLELIGEALGYGTEAVADASTHTITMADGATDGFRCTFLRLTGGGQACTVTLAPNTLSHTWIIRNTTGYALTLTQGSGANVIIAAGLAKMVTTDGLGSGAVVYECLEALELGGTLTVGVDDTGYDVQFFGATSGAHMLWDASVDDLKLVGAAGLTVAGGSTLNSLIVNQTITAGADDAGYDVQFFGATASAHLLWDASEDDLKLVGAAGLTVAGNSVLNTLDVNSTLDVGGAATFTTEITANGGIALGDSDEATFGASDDLKIYHDGSNSRINDSGTGVLVLQGSEVHVNNAASDENMISAVQDGAVTLHHNGSARVATSDDGATVTGNLLFGTSSKGVYLGVTSATAANLLDDYEEGTWTGTLLGSTTTPGSAITATGYYTKYGRDVHASLYMQNVNTTGFAGDIQISGLPFTVSATTVGSAGLYNIALQHAVGAFSRADSTTDDVKFFKSRDATTWISASHSAGTGRYLLLDVTYILT